MTKTSITDLPEGILRKIAVEHLDNLEDFETFGEVCSSWRSEINDVNYRTFCASKNAQLPWLMLADPPTNTYRRFYSLSKGMYRKINLPRFDNDPDDHRKFFSSKGWLIAVSMKHALLTFFDLFSRTVINPPSIPLLQFTDGDLWDDTDYTHRFSKFVFSTHIISPSDTDFQVATIFDHPKHLAFWSLGQQHWILPLTGIYGSSFDNYYGSSFDNYQIEDVCFFRGLFYSIDNYTQIVAFSSEEKRPRILANLISLGFEPSLAMMFRYHIVVFGTTLLVIQRRPDPNSDFDKCYTESFRLFEINVDDRVKVTQVYSIGNRALFVGFNSTFFVEPSSTLPHGCRPNCIYFTDDNHEIYGAHDIGGGVDMGIYSLEENKVVAPVYEGPSQLSHETPPLWVELPHSALR